jgi:16S rRNA C1402 N4-methylase RsmH
MRASRASGATAADSSKNGRNGVLQGGLTFAALTKKPLVAQDDERQLNPRARSAKLRAIQRQG